ncbi:hypothetical protein EW026_g6576 [Hermanssonia centrifuga]|uniref:Sorbose reductase sou1 n=1 Tax=Hermanssonia centrifuga TaxID=98765 RepID=A0A4S4KAM1_9APHY|nr:hypothetical protein EW026_g6576 [Hermanssonia centrifuga]
MSLLFRRFPVSARTLFIARPAPIIATRTTTRVYTTGTEADNQSKTGKPPSYAPIGVDAALKAPSSGPAPTPTLLSKEFSLADRVGLVSGGNRGLGLEMAYALIEAGARAVYCIDLPKTPSEDWQKVHAYAARLHGKGGEGRLEYISADKAIWKIGETIGDREGRMDVCVAAAGILKQDIDCLEYPADTFQEVINVNVNGVLYTAQAAGRQMRRFGNGGSIILVGSMSGSITNQGHSWVSYNTSKSAVLQMARSMACELGKEDIRVNSLSPGYIYTKLTGAFVDKQPGLIDKWISQNPQGRIGRPDELRGVVTWLASDASTYCTGSECVVSLILFKKRAFTDEILS